MWTTIITAGVAAFVAFLFAILNESIRDRRSFAQRWDKDLFDRVASFLGHASRIVHFSSASSETDLSQRRSSLHDAHEQLRISCNQLLLIASPSVAVAALQAQRDAYAVVETARGLDDPRPGTIDPLTRLFGALDALTTESRKQLRLPPIASNRLPG